jgi:hypothetical protein
MTNSTWTIGKATFSRVELEIPYEGKPTGQAERAIGKITTYKAETSDLSSVKFGVVTWSDGSSEVVPIAVLPGGQRKYERLENAGRLTLLNFGSSWVGELNAMKFNQERQRTNLATASLSDLDHFSEQSVNTVLSEFGSFKIGSREELHGETNKNRGRLAILCDAGNKDMVAAVYVITRVLAILKDFGAK